MRFAFCNKKDYHLCFVAETQTEADNIGEEEEEGDRQGSDRIQSSAQAEPAGKTRTSILLMFIIENKI